jgi:hypothetical protein
MALKRFCSAQERGSTAAAGADQAHTSRSQGLGRPRRFAQRLGQEAVVTRVDTPRPSRRSRPAGRDTYGTWLGLLYEVSR